ncbi:MAG: GNAT family N-acetyltransferase [Oscillospiraceae bacterium]|nr:GNAT family N-acetyltransferase [Oscillospiraceae bacterium]
MTFTDPERIEVQQMLLRGIGDVLYRGEAGAIIRDPEGTLVSDIASGHEIAAQLTALGIERPCLITVRSEQAREELAAVYALQSAPDTVFVYTLAQAPARDGSLSFGVLPERHLAEAAAHYDMMENSESYLRARMEAGLLWAAADGEKLMGFIGVHSDGSMGMLEVLPAYRRRGLGYQLEAFAIAEQLRRGWTPYCHVMQGNTASEALQQKLGLTKAQNPAHWMWTQE